MRPNDVIALMAALLDVVSETPVERAAQLYAQAHTVNTEVCIKDAFERRAAAAAPAAKRRRRVAGTGER